MHEFFAEPFDDPGPWTGAPTRLRVEWDLTSARFLRDGVVVTAVDWSDRGLFFGPAEPRFMLGSPRNDGEWSAMPLHVRFSDLRIEGELGSVSSCTQPDAGIAVDASTVDAPMPADAGVEGGEICATQGLALADATAASWETGVFPDDMDLHVEGDGSAPLAIVYMRFLPPNNPVSSAWLRLRVAETQSAGGMSGRVCLAEGDWNENTLTWSNRPHTTDRCVGTSRQVTHGEWVAWDVSELVEPSSTLNFALVSTDEDGVH